MLFKEASVERYCRTMDETQFNTFVDEVQAALPTDSTEAVSVVRLSGRYEHPFVGKGGPTG